MTDTHQLPSLPTLQPGDSHMESLIEAAIQGHASTREAMRWLVRQLVPATQPAEVTDEEIDYAVLQTVGFDGIGTQEMSQFDCRNIARAILALRPVQVPMNQDEAIAAIKSANISSSTTFWSIFEAGIRAAEAHHGITVKAKKEGV